MFLILTILCSWNKACKLQSYIIKVDNQMLEVPAFCSSLVCFDTSTVQAVIHNGLHLLMHHHLPGHWKVFFAICFCIGPSESLKLTKTAVLKNANALLWICVLAALCLQDVYWVALYLLCEWESFISCELLPLLTTVETKAWQTQCI